MKENLFFQKDAEIFRWGPIPGRYYYVSEFEEAIFKKGLNAYKEFRWPNTLFMFKDNRMIWINDFNALREVGKKIFLEYMFPLKTRKDLKKNWYKFVKELKEFEFKLDEKDFSKLSDNELYNLWDEFFVRVVNFWVPTIPCELGNYGSEDLLKEKLKNYIKNPLELISAMEILTAPDELSFYQKEEIDLANTNNIKEHVKKYNWLKNSYNGVEQLSVDFFLERKKNLNNKTEQITKEHIEDVKRKKKEIIAKYKLPEEVENISSALCEGIAWQDERKKYIFIFMSYKEFFLKEVAKRFKYNIDYLRNYSNAELMKVLKKKKLVPKIDLRRDLFGFYINPNQKELTKEEVLFCWKNYSEEKVDDNVREIRGIVASSGREKIVSGRVKIVLDPNKTQDFKEGSILVTPMTSPEFVFLMKRSKAIITDAGGLTSHASIVSRELKVSCIVGTKIATQVLRDGDLIEIDAYKGIIRVLEKS